MVAPFGVSCVQTEIISIDSPGSKASVIKRNLERSVELVERGNPHGRAKFYVFPEFWLQGFEMGRSVAEWQQICIQIPGEETEVLGALARRAGAYLAGAAWEYDHDWPDRWFNAGFLIGPSGDVVLKYRKINDANVNGILNDTTPGDVYSRYIEMYGVDAIFPVVETPYAKVGMMICYDVNFPEVARALALKGAELILFPTGEPYHEINEGWEIARRARAYENQLYLASCNHGAFLNASSPRNRSRGRSELVGFDGRVIAVADGPGEAIVQGTVDIEYLRWKRTQPAINFLAQLRGQLYAPVYAGLSGVPNDCFLASPIEDPAEGAGLICSVIERYQHLGIFTPPSAVISTDPGAAAQAVAGER